MATYGPSRAKPNSTQQSRHNPLNGNKPTTVDKFSSLPPIHNQNNNNNQNQTNNPVPSLSSHPQYLMHNNNNNNHQLPTTHTHTHDTETNNSWDFGVGLIKSVWSNVVKPALTQNHISSTQASDESLPSPDTCNISSISHENEYNNDNICRLLDSDALTQRVREIVQLDDDIKAAATEEEDDDILQYDIFNICEEEPKTNKKKYDDTTHFEDLIDGNLVNNAQKYHPMHHIINESVVNDKKRARKVDNTQNNNEPPRKRPKIESNPLPVGVIRSPSRPRPKTETDVTRALQQGIDIIRQSTPLQTSRKRARNTFEDSETGFDGNFAPPQAKKARIEPSTPILSQETEISEFDIADSATPISRRDFRLHHVKEDETPKVSICCSIQVLQERKCRYLRVYKQRFTRIYSKYKLQNVALIDKWMSMYGGDVDKLHGLYENICVKYDLFACRKYEGQIAEYEPNENEEEICKSCGPKIVKPIKIDLNLVQVQVQVQQPQALTRENVDKHTNNNNNNNNNDLVEVVGVDNGYVSDKSDTNSTFHTPKIDKYKERDIDIQSTKSDTLTIVLPHLAVQAPIDESFFKTSKQDELQSNEKWDGTADLSHNAIFEYDHDGGFSSVFSDNNKINAPNNDNNTNNNNGNSEIFSGGPMKFMIPDTLPPTNMNNGQNNNNNLWGNNPFTGLGNGNNNNEWNMNNNQANNNNNNFNALNNNQQNNNQQNNNLFAFSNNQNNSWLNANNDNNNWSTPINNNNNNNNQFNFDGTNNNNNSRSCSVDQSFFTPSSNKKRKKRKATRRFSK